MTDDDDNMRSMRIYLDFNATQPLRSEARLALMAALDLTGNASSVHTEGRRARAMVDGARAKVARLVGAAPGSVVFTSGATEANVAALSPDWVVGGRATRFSHLLVCAVEHPASLRGGQFAAGDVSVIPVDHNGVIDLDALERMTADIASAGGRPLVALQLANNETGVIEPFRAAADIVHARDGFIHGDAVQAAGRIPVDINELRADTLALSSHKLGGPQGVGALVLADVARHPRPLLTGGMQEFRLRAGTEPVAAIAAFGAAAEASYADRGLMPDVAARRNRLETALMQLTPNAVIFSCAAPRLPNTTAISVPGVSAETAVIAFDLGGAALSSGSACSSGKVTPSHVLQAMGVSADLARGALRISIGTETTDDHIDRFIALWSSVMSRLTRAKAG